MSEEKPMTVGDLIEKLNEFDQNLPVVFRKDYYYEGIEYIDDKKTCFINLD